METALDSVGCCASPDLYCMDLSEDRLCSSGYHRSVSITYPYYNMFELPEPLWQDNALICSLCSAPTEMMSLQHNMHAQKHTAVNAHAHVLFYLKRNMSQKVKLGQRNYFLKSPFFCTFWGIVVMYGCLFWILCVRLQGENWHYSHRWTPGRI